MPRAKARIIESRNAEILTVAWSVVRLGLKESAPDKIEPRKLQLSAARLALEFLQARPAVRVETSQVGPVDVQFNDGRPA